MPRPKPLTCPTCHRPWRCEICNNVLPAGRLKYCSDKCENVAKQRRHRQRRRERQGMGELNQSAYRDKLLFVLSEATQ